MIENVEHFCAELKLEQLSDREVAMHGEIPFRRTEPSQSVSSKTPLPRGIPGMGVHRRIAKRAWVDRFPARVLRSVDVKRDSGDDIRPNVHFDAVIELKEVGILEVHRSRRTRQHKTLRRPVPEDSSDEWVALQGGNAVGDAGTKRVPDVEARTSPVLIRAPGDTQVRWVSRGTGRPIVDRVRPTVRGKSLQSGRQPPMKLQLQRI